MYKNKKAFTLVELILYLGIFVIIGGLFFGVLTQVVRISSQETSGNEVTNQLNFTMQAINRLVKSSSNIEISAGLSTSTLKLRLSFLASDPTCIYLSDSSILLAEGPDTLNPQNCKTDSNKIKSLTTSKVIVDSLNFKKLTFYPGHDQVLVDIQMSSANSNPTSKVARTLHSAISRVSAATFDSDLLPGSTTYNLGNSGSNKWNNIYVGNLLNLGQLSADPTCPANGSIYYNTNSNSFRGCQNGNWADIGSNLWTATSTNMYSNVSGNVGIGTTAPYAPLTIKVATDKNIGVRLNGINPELFSANDANNAYQIMSINASKLALNAISNGNIGIGISDPLVKLDLKTSNGGEPFRFSLNTADYHSISTGYHGEDASQNYLGFNIEYGSNDIRRVMTLRGNGNVGIGTITPTDKLEVSGNIKATGNITVYNGNPRFILEPLDANTSRRNIDISDTGANARLRFYKETKGTDTTQEYMTILSGGNVGIGTSAPNSLLEVGSAGYFQFSKTSVGAPSSTDCDSDDERGRLAISTGYNRLYICNGATRGWDYTTLTN